MDLSRLSLLLSGLSFILFAIQTLILWNSRNQTVEAPLIQLRAEACKTLIENYQEFSNLNASLRVTAADYMNKSPDSIEITKGDSKSLQTPSKDDQERTIIKLTQSTADSGYKAQTHANTILHLFPSEMRKTIIESQTMIPALMTEPKGNARVHPDDFSRNLSQIMRDCQLMTDSVLESGS